MRMCPTCQRTYPDDNQSNCAFDGAPLSAPYAPQPAQYQQQQYGPPPGGPAPPPPGYPAPGGWQGYPPPAYQGGTSQYVPCPQCNRPDPEKVGFSWWGGLIGPRMLTHVKCRWCRKTYNGKTGKDNTTGIVIYSIVVFVIFFGLFLAIFLGTR